MGGGLLNPANWRLTPETAELAGLLAPAVPPAGRAVRAIGEMPLVAARGLADASVSALPRIIGRPYRGWTHGSGLLGFFDAPLVTNQAMKGRPVTEKGIAQFREQAQAAGQSDEWIGQAVARLREYNRLVTRKAGAEVGSHEAEVHDFLDDVVMRIGVLNTPALSGERFNRVRTVMDAIEAGKAHVDVPRLGGEGAVRISIPKELRGKTVREFYNVPITDPVLRQPKPQGFDFPLVVTGNPHLRNFVRPHPSWDSVIKTVRVKPVYQGNAATNTAVASAINYAHEIGAKPLVTTFRSKSLWDLAKAADVVPTSELHPDFAKYWKRNPAPPTADVRSGRAQATGLLALGANRGDQAGLPQSGVGLRLEDLRAWRHLVVAEVEGAGSRGAGEGRQQGRTHRVLRPPGQGLHLLPQLRQDHLPAVRPVAGDGLHR
jgi:hypothetical protein